MRVLTVNLIKLFFILSTSTCLIGCKKMKLIEAYKIRYAAGLPNISNYIEYSIIVKLNVDFNINSIQLKNNKYSNNIPEFSFIKLENNAGHKVINYPKNFERGIYNFTFSVNEKDVGNLDDIIEINYSINNKRDTLKIKVKKTTKTLTNK